MRLRILLVEPEPHARQGLQTILATDGHEVSVAQDLAAGLARLVAQRFDLLLLDADQPPAANVRVGVNDLLRLALRETSGVHAIVLASEPEEVLPRPGTPGVVAVLEKPVELSSLRGALRAAASGSERAPGV